MTSYTEIFEREASAIIGITAGASCPNNLIEETILKVFELRGVSVDQIEVT